jgi:hypothetical protein
MWVQVCADGSFDLVTQTCSDLIWTNWTGSVLPPLSAEDGLTISASILGVWAIGWAIRICKRAIRR